MLLSIAACSCYCWQDVDWYWQIVNKAQQIGLARHAGQSGWGQIGIKISRGLKWKYFPYDLFYLGPWFGIFSDKCFLLVWIGKRGWVLGGAMFENLQSHRWNIRRPKFSLCHEIWWTLNPTFKWEKILHQDTIYPQLMSWRRKLW